MSEHLVELQAAWLGHVGASTRPLDAIVSRHREPHRHYHGVEHLVWAVRHVLELATHETLDDLDAVVAAAFFHDAVYDPTSPDNEGASARLAAHELAQLGWQPDRIARVTEMIQGTAHHTEPFDTDTAVLFDADLAVLGADPAGYGDYVRGVRAEYAHVDDEAWATGRAEVLRGFAERASIYATVSGVERWEHRARGNVAAELAELTGAG